jgi:hypothetical protein
MKREKKETLSEPLFSPLVDSIPDRLGGVNRNTAYGQYDIAMVIGLINFLALRLLTPVKQAIDEKAEASPGDEA